MNLYRIVFDGYSRVRNESFRVVLLRSGMSPTDAFQGVHTLYHNIDTGETKTSGGFGPMANSVVLDEWSVVSIRKSRAKGDPTKGTRT